MQRNDDLGLIQAKKAQVLVREKKALLLVKETRHFKQNERFLGMTGITLQEKSFRNMIDFNKHALLKIMKSEARARTESVHLADVCSTETDYPEKNRVDARASMFTRVSYACSSVVNNIRFITDISWI